MHRTDVLAGLCRFPTFRRAVVFAFLQATQACQNFASPNEVEDVLIASAERSLLLVVESSTGRILDRLGPIPPFAYARSPDGALAFYSGSTESFAELVGLDVRSLRIAWREYVRDLEARSEVVGLELTPYLTAIAPTPDGTRLVVAPARRADKLGIAVLNYVTRTPVSFVDSFVVPYEGMVMLAVNAALPSGGIAIAAGRPTTSGQSDGWLFILDGTTLSRVDSIRLTQGVSHPWAELGPVVASPSGTKIYVRGPGVVFGYDLAKRERIGTVQVPPYCRLYVAPADGSLLAIDGGGGGFSAGSGILYRFSSDLTSVDTFDLREAAVSGQGPTIQAAAQSRDGQRFYVLIGNPSVGPPFAGQRLRILVVEIASRRVIRSLPLNTFGAGTLLVQ